MVFQRSHDRFPLLFVVFLGLSRLIYYYLTYSVSTSVWALDSRSQNALFDYFSGPPRLVLFVVFPLSLLALSAAILSSRLSTTVDDLCDDRKEVNIHPHFYVRLVSRVAVVSSIKCCIQTPM